MNKSKDNFLQPSLNLFPYKHFCNQKISFSRLRVFQRCPHEYKLRYVDGSKLDVNTIDVQVGTLIHRLLGNYLQEKSGHEDNVLFDELNINFDKIYFRDTEEKIFWLKRTNRILSTFIEYNNVTGVFPFATELDFKVHFDQFLIKGRVDRIDKLDSDYYEIIDYKLDEVKVDKHVNNNLQLFFYYWGIKKQYHFNIKRLTYYYLENNKSCSVDMNESLEKQSYEVLVNLIRQMLNEKNFHRIRSPFCDICGVRKICK